MDAETNINPRQTHGVKTLLGDPKKAILRLGIPMIVAMSVQTLYNLIDAIWVAGKGPEALAAVGFFFPFTMLIIAISTGIGVGGGAIISQFIGAREPKKADSAAAHSLVIMVICAFVIMIPCLVFAEPIFKLMGAATSLDRTLAFARIIFAGTLFSFFGQVGTSLLRSEGDSKRVMIAMLLTAILNIVLDPFFIYKFNVPLPGGSIVSIGLDLDVAGAGYATLISMIAGSALGFYWLFIKKNTYLTISFKNFRFDGKITGAIVRIGVPTALMQLSMSIMMFLITVILAVIGGDTSVAVFSTGWRIVMVAILPILGIGAAVTAVGGAAFGAREYGKLNTAYYYALRLGTLICLGFSVFTFVFAPLISRMFTWSPDTAPLIDKITLFLRYMCLFFPATAGGMIASSVFQGVGKGLNSLVVTILRTLVIAVPLAAILGIVFNLKMEGVYIGIIAANWTSSIIAVIWAHLHIRKLMSPELECIPLQQLKPEAEI
jgi:putative MATE family efflux protein